MEQTPEEFVCMEKKIQFDFRRPTGHVVGLFLAELRDEKKIIGSECRNCGKVFVPPSSYCEICSGETNELREVGPSGIVISWTRVEEDLEDMPAPAPFRYVMIRLAGADTPLLHIAPDDPGIEIGAIVVPVFQEIRTGSIKDIKWFVPGDEEIGV